MEHRHIGVLNVANFGDFFMGMLDVHSTRMYCTIHFYLLGKGWFVAVSEFQYLMEFFHPIQDVFALDEKISHAMLQRGCLGSNLSAGD